MAAFPSTLKPSVNEGYNFGSPNNLISQQVQGGAPLVIQDYRTGPVDFTVTIVCDPLRLQVFQDFYFGKINSGAAAFTMNLDSGNGIEEHTVRIIPQSLAYDGTRAPIYRISFGIVAKSTPFQEDPFEGALSDLYDAYGNDLPTLLDRLEQFALVDLV